MDPELEFDREVYPLGLLPNAGVVVGVSQRLSFLACTEFPCFEPTPQAQTILHCLLRHLLQVSVSTDFFFPFPNDDREIDDLIAKYPSPTYILEDFT